MTESCGKSKQTLIHLEVQFHAHRILPLQVLLLFQVVMTRFSCEARAMLLTSVPWTNTELELKANHEAFIGGCSKCAGLQQLSFLRALPEAAQFSTQGYLQLQLKKKIPLHPLPIHACCLWSCSSHCPVSAFLCVAAASNWYYKDLCVQKPRLETKIFKNQWELKKLHEVLLRQY